MARAASFFEGIGVALDGRAKACENKGERRFRAMELSEQQRQAVKDWVAAGASLSDVQRNLKSEFNVAMTYMDVRLLVLDLGAAIKDKPEPKPVRTESSRSATVPAGDDPGGDAALDEGDAGPEEGDDVFAVEPDADGGAGMAAKVSLTLDRLVVPGAMVSGTVTFSDGVKARWLIDQMGRFGLEADKPGYHPSNADLQAFQMQLRTELRQHGYA